MFSLPQQFIIPQANTDSDKKNNILQIPYIASLIHPNEYAVMKAVQFEKQYDLPTDTRNWAGITFPKDNEIYTSSSSVPLTYRSKIANLNKFKRGEHSSNFQSPLFHAERQALLKAAVQKGWITELDKENYYLNNSNSGKFSDAIRQNLQNIGGADIYSLYGPCGGEGGCYSVFSDILGPNGIPNSRFLYSVPFNNRNLDLVTNDLKKQQEAYSSIYSPLFRTSIVKDWTPNSIFNIPKVQQAYPAVDNNNIYRHFVQTDNNYNYPIPGAGISFNTPNLTNNNNNNIPQTFGSDEGNDTDSQRTEEMSVSEIERELAKDTNLSKKIRVFLTMKEINYLVYFLHLAMILQMMNTTFFLICQTFPVLIK